MTELVWYEASSADDGHDDQETDLTAIGSPHGAAWATVYPEYGGTWVYEIFDHWTYDAATVVASGSCSTEDEAKSRVAAWVFGV